MKFQDSSFNGLKVTVGTKSVTHPLTHAPKAICPINFFKVGGIISFVVRKLAFLVSEQGQQKRGIFEDFDDYMYYTGIKPLTEESVFHSKNQTLSLVQSESFV